MSFDLRFAVLCTCIYNLDWLYVYLLHILYIFLLAFVLHVATLCFTCVNHDDDLKIFANVRNVSVQLSFPLHVLSITLYTEISFLLD